jgi:hypothetical protein
MVNFWQFLQYLTSLATKSPLTAILKLVLTSFVLFFSLELGHFENIIYFTVFNNKKT